MKYEKDIFLSYSTHDQDIIDRLQTEIENRKYLVWRDRPEIGVGDYIEKKIQEGLHRTRYLAIWVTEHSIASPYVKFEYEAKIKEEDETGVTCVIPLLGEVCIISREFKALEDKKYADFTDSFNKGLDEFLKMIEPNCSVMINYYIERIREGMETDLAARRLGDIVLRSNDEDAMWGLWIAVQDTKDPEVIDHCAFTVGRVIIEPTDPDPLIQKIVFEIIGMGIKSGSETIRDKFTYTINRIANNAKSESVKKQALQFIKNNL